MTAIHRRRIDDRSAWTPAETNGRDGLTRRMSGDELAALDALLERTRPLAKFAITRRDFDHPAVNRLMDEVRREIMDGHGVVILAGFDPTRHDQEDYERLYWGLGTHLGNAAIQSGKGDLIGYVEKTDAPVSRGYISDMELRPHTDFHEILSLASVRLSAAGGISGIASGPAIHNAMLAERPELLPPLYEGFYYALPGLAGKDPPITSEKMPVFSVVDGKLSCMSSRVFMAEASRRLGTALPDDLVEALAYFNQLAVRDDIQARFMLEPGEMLFWHNWTNLHSRTEFRDTPEQKRLLLRLWLNVPDGRAAIPLLGDWAARMDRTYAAMLAAA
jgi:hypothetical protein